ncbi:MAG: hypothetical protein M1812_002612 [Candelaria pacifica]|nr:MAG: hypothetical protein M1812_002612 [Candelaria pacifica]
MDAPSSSLCLINRPQGSSFSGSLNAAPEATWTAARCNRLLRPIGSRINLLRKHYRKASFTAGLELLNQAEVNTRTNGANQGPRGCTVDQSSLGLERRSRRTDPDWIPRSELRKKVKHKYSSRGNEDGRQLAGSSSIIKARAKPRRVSPDATTVPTPFLSRKKGQSDYEGPEAYGKAQSSASNEFASAAVCELRRPRMPCPGNLPGQQPAVLLHRLKRVTEESSWALIEGIVNGFDTLLKATTASLKQDQIGARSLLSTCLRKVPEYIAQEQQWQQGECENEQLNVSSEVYADLEEFGSSQGYGWTPLSEVVRAHGVTLLRDAIYEGLLTQDTARALIQLCIHHSAHDEAESFVSCLVSIQIPDQKPADCKTLDHQMSGLSTLNLFAQQTGRYGFQYREISSLLVAGRLCVERLANRESITLWGHAVKSISHVGEYCTDAVRLLCTAIRLACDSSSLVQGDLVHRFRLSLLNHRGRHGCKTRAATSRRHCSSTTFANHGETRSITKTGSDFEVDAALSKLVSRLLTILSATALCRAKSAEIETNEAGPQGLDIRVITGLAMTVRGISELKHTVNRTIVHSEERIALVLMAGNLLPVVLQPLAEASSLIGTDRTRTPTTTIAVGLPHYVSTVYGRLTDLAIYVNAVACCAGRISQGNGFGYIQILSDYLIDLSTSSIASTQVSSVERQAFSSIGLQSAFLFAEENPSTAHFEYTEKIGQVANGEGFIEGSLSRRGCEPYSRRFRWEEGISEWVAATPAPNNKKRKLDARRSSTATPSLDERDCASSTESSSQDTEMTSPEDSSDQDELNELDELPIAMTRARGGLGSLAQDIDRSGRRTTGAKSTCITATSQPSRKKRLVPCRLTHKAQGKSGLTCWGGEVESEDELSFT